MSSINHNNHNLVIRDSVQSLILTALHASEASSGEAANAFNAILDAERSLLPEVVSQLRRSNQITEEVYQALLQMHEQEANNNNTDNDNSNNNSEQNASSGFDQELKRIATQNQEKLKNFYEERISALEKENGELYAALMVEQQQIKINSVNSGDSGDNDNNNNSNDASETTLSRLVAQIRSTEEQLADLIEKSKSAVETERNNNQRNHDDESAAAPLNEDDGNVNLASRIMTANSNNNNNNNKHNSSFSSSSFSKEAWYAALQQLEENAKKCLRPEEAEQIKQDLENWKTRAAKSIERVATLETDVNTLRFSNGVMKEQMASVLTFSEKMMMVLLGTGAQNNNNNNVFSVPQDIQQILQLRRQNSNNNQHNNALLLRSQDFLTSNNGASAAFRTIENVEEVSSSSRKVSNNITGTHHNIHLGAFAFDDVKQMLERFDELTQALYRQETSSSTTNNNNNKIGEQQQQSVKLLDQRKRHRNEDQDDAAAAVTDSSQSSNNNTRNHFATDDRGCQTDESDLLNYNNNNSKNRHLGNGSTSVSRDGEDSSVSATKEILEINSDPQIFNALRQITLDLESGFALSCQSESELNQVRLTTSRQEIAALQQQLDDATNFIKTLAREKSVIETRERIANETIEALKAQLRDQIAIEVQIPMLNEVPAILTRFEAVLSSIASYNQNESDEQSAKAIALDSLQHRLGGLENVLLRLQSQYNAFSDLSIKNINRNSSHQLNNNNNNNNKSNGHNFMSSSSAEYDALVTSIKNRVLELESELESQGQDLENERNRIINQLERMFQAEEQARQLRNEMKELRTTAISSQQAQELHDEISSLQDRNARNIQQSDLTINNMRTELLEWKSKTASLQEQIVEANARSRTFEQERNQVVAQRNRSNADLEAAGQQITVLSRQLHEARRSVDTLSQENRQLRDDKESLKTSFLSQDAVRREFTRLFPNDSAGTEALSRLSFLDQELKSKSDEVRSLTLAKHRLEGDLTVARDQLQASESERLTSRMRTATAESSLKNLQDSSSKEIAALNNNLSYLKQDCQRLSIERDAAVERAQLLTLHVDVLSQDQLSANARLYGLTETRSFTEQMKEIHLRNENIQQNLNAARNTIAQRAEEIATLISDLNQEKDASADLRKQIADAHKLEGNLRDSLASIEESLKTTVETLERTQGQLHSMTHDRDAKQREIENHLENISNLETNKSQLEGEKQKLEEQVVRLREAVEDRDELVAAARRAVEASGGGGGNNNNNSSSVLSGSFSVGANSNSKNIGRFTNAVSSS